jgi:hypothetical protein
LPTHVQVIWEVVILRTHYFLQYYYVMWMICRRTDEERNVDGGDSFLQTHALWAFRVARQWLWLVHPWTAMACLSSCGNKAIFFAFPVWVGMVRMSQESGLLWSNYIASGRPRTLNSTLCVGTKRIVRTENQRKLKALTFFCCLDGRDGNIYKKKILRDWFLVGS